jgi:monovalent cation/hydrogen antiporter
MPAIELLIVLVAAAVVLGMLARWLRLPYPILLVLGGLLISLQPDAPRLQLEPSIVFILFLPPLLYAGAFNTHWPEFRKHLRSITLLALGLVLFTVTAVAWAAHTYCGFDWPEAFVLGAVISPPDAVAAMAVGKLVRLPKVVATILEGESLLNDASALVAYRVAVAWVLGGVFSWQSAGLDFVIATGGGIAVGLVGAVAIIRFHRWAERRRLVDEKLSITITLLTPYALYVPAEHLHLSGVLAVVTAGMWIGHRATTVFDCDFMREARAVWEWIEFLLNSLVFILIGLQLTVVIDTLDDTYTLPELAIMAAIIAGVTIATRVLWMYPGAYLPRWFDQYVLGKPVRYPPLSYVTVTAWTGMRGVVSLAAALALPMTLPDGKPFPHRDLILFLTFWTIFATLVGQGLTLPLVVRLLGVHRHPKDEPPPPAQPGNC